MQQSLLSIITILLLLVAGWGIGQKCSLALRAKLVGSLGSIVLVLLFCMGLDFTEVFSDVSIGYPVVLHAALLALLISACLTLALYRKRRHPLPTSANQHFLVAFRGCITAIVAFIAGIVVGHLTHFTLAEIHLSSNYVLYILVFFVGIDLVGFKFSGVTRQLMVVPVVTLLATYCGAGLFTLVTHYSWQQALVVSSGFGWFSLSGPMVHQLVSVKMGAMAFMTDFFRELLSIVFLYFYGQRQPYTAIGLAGAAAMDSALPFIKQNCENRYIPHAVISGFLLTLLAPLCLTFSISLLLG